MKPSFTQQLLQQCAIERAEREKKDNGIRSKAPFLPESEELNKVLHYIHRTLLMKGGSSGKVVFTMHRLVKASKELALLYEKSPSSVQNALAAECLRQIREGFIIANPDFEAAFNEITIDGKCHSINFKLSDLECSFYE